MDGISAVAESVTVDRRPMRTLGMLFVLSGRVRELSARCPEDVPGVARSRARCLSGSGQLTRAAGCMWCAFQEQSRRLTRMVSVAVATPRGDPCGGVPRGDFGELHGSPQSYCGDITHVAEMLRSCSKYLIGWAKKSNV